jgi:tRNA pseudouridine32 synthase/23S rRNA pseudouridine746 synthase
VHFRLVQSFPSAALVHRLDFGTSGIMLVALNRSVNAALTNQFQRREVAKTYTAVLHGHLAEDEGLIDLPIAKDKPNFPRMKICPETGKSASSLFTVLERFDSPMRTRVCFKPVTGRTHQLRLHSQQLGCPIVGCDLYGLPAYQMPQSEDGLGRLMLHATTLTFTHPKTGKKIEAESPPPF